MSATPSVFRPKPYTLTYDQLSGLESCHTYHFLKPSEPPLLPPGFEYYEGEARVVRMHNDQCFLFLVDPFLTKPAIKLSSHLATWIRPRAAYLIINKELGVMSLVSPYWDYLDGTLLGVYDNAEVYNTITDTCREQAKKVQYLRALADDK